MPVDGVNAGGAATTSPYNFSIGANAQAAKDAKDAKAATVLTEAQKEQQFLQKMNEGRKTEHRARTAENQDKLGKDDFMKLLIATLKYQDPSSPMDTQKLLEQTSIMTNMEQMIKMTEASQKSFEAQQKVQGTSMVGKTVVYDSTNAEGKAVTTAGKVDAIEFLAKGEVLLHIGNEKVKMDKVLGVADASEDDASNIELDPLQKAIKAAQEKIAALEQQSASVTGDAYRQVAEQLDAARANLAALEQKAAEKAAKETDDTKQTEKAEKVEEGKAKADTDPAAARATQGADQNGAAAAAAASAAVTTGANKENQTTDKTAQTSGAGASGEEK